MSEAVKVFHTWLDKRNPDGYLFIWVATHKTQVKPGWEVEHVEI